MKLIKIFCGHRSTFLHLDTFVEKEMTEKEKSPMQSLATAHKGLKKKYFIPSIALFGGVEKWILKNHWKIY